MEFDRVHRTSARRGLPQGREEGSLPAEEVALQGEGEVRPFLGGEVGAADLPFQAVEAVGVAHRPEGAAEEGDQVHRAEEVVEVLPFQEGAGEVAVEARRCQVWMGAEGQQGCLVEVVAAEVQELGAVPA